MQPQKKSVKLFSNGDVDAYLLYRGSTKTLSLK